MTTIDAHDITALIVGGTALDVISATLTLDEGWSPYAQAQLTCANSDALRALDPRTGRRVQVVMRRSFGDSDPVSELSTEWAGLKLSDLSTLYAGQRVSAISAPHYRAWNTFGPRAAVTRTVDLSVRSRTPDLGSDEVTVRLASDEALLQDYALVAQVPYSPGFTSVRACATFALRQIGATLAAGTDDGEVNAESSQWLPGVSAWDWISPLVQAADLRLWCDELRVFHLTASDALTPGQISLSTDTTLTKASDTIDLAGDWYDAVVIVYTWTDDLNVSQTRYDIATSENYKRVLRLEYATAYPGPGAAAAVLRRMQQRGDVLDLTAVSDYAASPAVATAVTLNGVEYDTVASSVAWSYPDAEMTIKTRAIQVLPETAWLSATGSWDSQPTGASWASDS